MTTSKISLKAALQRLGLTERFAAFCRAGATDAQARAWLARHPQLFELADMPLSLQYIRRGLNARGPRGGARPPGKKFYVVKS